jgi:hypothetical protein
VLAAAAMIVAALVVRNALDDGDDSGGRGGGGGGELVVACPPELDDACATLDDGADVRVEPAAATADRLAQPDGGGDAAPDVWLAPAPWAEAVDDRRARAGLDDLLGEPSGVIARSPVAVAIWDEQARALEAGACGGTVTWLCLGDVAERPWSDVGGEPGWGRVIVGLTDPDSATGRVVLGGAVAGFFGSGDYASNDFGGSLPTWLLGIAASADAAASGEPVAQMLTRGQGAYSAVGALEASARQAAGRDNLRVIYPSPVVTADLVAIPVGDAADAASDVAADGDLRRRLAAAGWRVDGEPPAAGVDEGLALRDDDGLPGGPVLQALVDLWDQLAA